MRIDALDWHASAVELTSRLEVSGTGGHMGALSCSDYKDIERQRYLETILVENV